jgi:hypothetical protein
VFDVPTQVPCQDLKTGDSIHNPEFLCRFIFPAQKRAMLSRPYFNCIPDWQFGSFKQISVVGVTARQLNRYSDCTKYWTSDETINPVHTISPISLGSVLISTPFTLKPLQSSLPSRHSDQHFICHYHLSHACYKPCLISPFVMTTVTKQEVY